jgi:dynein light chain roadblock-type
VKASIILDRNSGAILKTSGDISALRTAKSRKESAAASFSNEVPAAEESESQGIEDFAASIWKYVKSSDGLIDELDAEV